LEFIIMPSVSAMMPSFGARFQERAYSDYVSQGVFALLDALLAQFAGAKKNPAPDEEPGSIE
jgi:hypothetical protein